MTTTAILHVILADTPEASAISMQQHILTIAHITTSHVKSAEQSSLRSSTCSVMTVIQRVTPRVAVMKEQQAIATVTHGLRIQTHTGISVHPAVK